MSNPLVTIGITAYNASDTIEQAVQSALAQSWRPIEIVAVDDKSVDETYEILKSMSFIHPELRVYRNRENVGVAVSRNKILLESKGTFVAFFDDDDESLPGRIEVQLERILKYEKQFPDAPLVICHTARRLIYPDGVHRIEKTMGLQENKRAPNGLAVAERILLGTPLENGNGACPACSQMARLSTYQTAGGFDSAFRRSEDTEFNVRLAKMGGHFVGIAGALVLQSMTKTVDKSLVDEHRFTQMLLKKHRDVPDRHGSFGFCRRWIDIKFCWLEGRKIEFIRSLIKLGFKHPRQVFQRLGTALPNIGLNWAFSRFHKGRVINI